MPPRYSQAEGPAPGATGPTGVDPEIISAQNALASAQTNLSNARKRYDDAAAKFDESSSQTQSSDGSWLVANPAGQKEASANLQRASIALGQSETEFATTSRLLATAHGNAATRATTPEGKAALTAQSHLYQSQSDLYAAQAKTHEATTAATLATANAQLIAAQDASKKTAAELAQVIPAQANNLNAAADQSRSSAKEADARTTVLYPAQAAAATGAAHASEAQAGFTNKQTADLLPAQVEEALQSAGLSEAQKLQIRQAMKLPKQLTTGVGERATLDFQDPATGQVTGQKDPAYTAANSQLLQNQADTIAQIQGMLEKGQMGPLEAQSYIDAVKAQSASALRGTTPFAESKQRQDYAQQAGGIGRDILDNRVSNATTLAGALLNSIKPTAGSNFDFSTLNPFDMAKGLVSDLGGGAAVGQTAQSLLQGVQSAGQPQAAPDGLPHDPQWGPINGQPQSLSAYAVNPQVARA